MNRPHLTLIAGRPVTRPDYARHGYLEAEPASASADDFVLVLTRLLGAALVALCLVACAALLLFRSGAA